jgi:hypothetical protein
MPDEVVEQSPADAAPDSAERLDDAGALSRVEALLAGQSGAEQETAQDDTPTPEETPADLTSLAERLKATPDKLYGIKVPLADGESRTIGELKDGYRTADQLRVERDKFHVERTQLDQDKRQALADLTAIMDRLPAQAVTPEAVQAVQQVHGEHLKRELAQLLETVPEWKDPVRYAAERPVMESYAAGLGFSPQDVAAITDHKVLRLLRTAALADKETKAERVKPPAKVGQAPRAGKDRTPAQQHGQLKAAVTSRRISPVDAVAQLLKG